MYKFYFDIRDIFRAPRLAFTGKKILIQFVGLLIGYLGILLLSYIARLSDGIPLSEIWQDYGLFPIVEFSLSHWYSWVIFLLGILFFIICWLFSNACVGKVTYEQLKGDEFYSAKESLRFLKRNWKPVLFAPGSLIIGIAFLVICGIIIGLLGKIPYVGELGLGLFYGFPIFVVAVFAVFAGFVFLVSMFLSPAVVATTKEDTFETIVQLFSTVWSQPWRYVIYTGVLAVSAKIVSFIFGYFCYRGVQLINWSAGILMKDKLSEIIEGASYYLSYAASLVNFFSNAFPGIRFKYHIPISEWGAEINWSGNISAFLIGITFILIFFVVISYALATMSVGQTLTYIILRKKKDDENLLERKTEEEEEEEKREKEREEEEKEKAEGAKAEEKKEGEETKGE